MPTDWELMGGLCKQHLRRTHARFTRRWPADWSSKETAGQSPSSSLTRGSRRMSAVPPSGAGRVCRTGSKLWALCCRICNPRPTIICCLWKRHWPSCTACCATRAIRQSVLSRFFQRFSSARKNLRCLCPLGRWGLDWLATARHAGRPVGLSIAALAASPPAGADSPPGA